MASKHGLLRKAHFLGTKIKSLRKRNHLTLEDLSVRCVQIDADAGPSVSYLSMIENGKRVPSELEENEIDPLPATAAVRGMPLEPAFLFSDNLLQSAIPELLAQTGTTGRQFAHLLIRAHQESNQNRFPDLERAAESVGKKQFPLSLPDVFDMAKDVGLKIKWFDEGPFRDKRETQLPLELLVRSFFDAPDTV